MAQHLEYSFGTPNFETAGRWLHLAPEDDRHVWMLNLMKYRAVADYGDARPSSIGGKEISGKEADDIYAPVDVLAALGATVALFGDVTAQLEGQPAWDRIGIVRYPTRKSFFDMQQRDDFQRQYVHKEAGMEFTIVMGTVPVAGGPLSSAGEGPLVMRVRRLAEGQQAGPDPEGVTPVARFAVDGVILGDERRWDEVLFDRVDAATLSRLGGIDGVEEQVTVVMDRPFIDQLVPSVVDAADAG